LPLPALWYLGAIVASTTVGVKMLAVGLGEAVVMHASMAGSCSS
jgi:hypothetical protein